MESVPFVVLAIYALVGLILSACLVYVWVKRIDDKKKEDFEKRDN